MTAIAASVQALGKRYRITHDREPYARLTETLWDALRHPFRRTPQAEEFWALRDVSFEVEHGDVVGIIGPNGAGKSTLLKILSRITEPTEGQALLHGRISSLLEVGTGFHPELTGRENIYLSGSILGMRRADIRRQFDEIVSFAEVERFLDTPVKRYSSGMQVRLGFAIAAHLEPDILVVDEVLAVGDAAFQRKSLAKMDDVAHGGRTVLFVSHNMAAVENLCRSAILLEGGLVAMEGDATDVVRRYVDQTRVRGHKAIDERTDRRGDGRLRFTGVTADIRTGQPSAIRLAFSSATPVENVEVSAALFTERGECVLYLANALVGTDFGRLPDEGEFVCAFPTAPLLPGVYSMNLYCTISGHLADWITDAAQVEVGEGDFFGTGRLPPPGYGAVAVGHSWTAEST